MPVRMAAVVLIGVLALPTVAVAQSRRSMARTWAGIGMMAGGVLVSFWEQDCRVAGALSDDPAVSIEFVNAAGSVAAIFDDARSPVSSRMSGRCNLDWTVDTYVGLELFGSIVNLERTRNTDGERASWRLPQSGRHQRNGKGRNILARWSTVRRHRPRGGRRAAHHRVGRCARRAARPGAWWCPPEQDVRLLNPGLRPLATAPRQERGQRQVPLAPHGWRAARSGPSVPHGRTCRSPSASPRPISPPSARGRALTVRSGVLSAGFPVSGSANNR